MERRILFVCSANQCRSPMAAEMFRKMLGKAGLSNIDVQSAGTLTSGGEPASSVTQEVASTMGLDLSDHSSQPVTAELLRNSDLVLVMEDIHRASIMGLCPDLDADRVRLLKSFAPHSQPGDPIPDPIGMPPLAFRSCFAQIMESLEGLLKAIKEENKAE